MRQQSGFSLLELSIVIAIISLMLAGGLSLSADIAIRANADDTIERLDVVADALDAYVRLNGELPCVAPLNLTPADAAFGSAISDCTAITSPPGGTFMSSNQRVRTGAVPIRELNLSERYARDAYGSSLIYAMNRLLSDDDVIKDFDPATGNPGEMIIISGQGHTITSEAAYLILSHGPNRMGAYIADTGALGPNSCSGTALDSYNCDHSDTATNDSFHVNEYNDGDTSLFFDDFVRWAHTMNLLY